MCFFSFFNDRFQTTIIRNVATSVLLREYTKIIIIQYAYISIFALLTKRASAHVMWALCRTASITSLCDIIDDVRGEIKRMAEVIS